MKLYFYTSVLALLGGLLYVKGYETGAPVLTCRTMVPGHGEAAQTTPAPYRILPSDVTSGRIRVTLTAPKANDYFTGFLIQARVPGAGENAIGSFVQVPQDSQTLDCNEITASGVTHGSNTKKKSVEFDWEAPSNFDGQIQFVATVVFDYATFWTGIVSDPIQVRGSRGAPSSSVGQTPQTGRAEQGVKEIESNIYNECGRSKNCVGSPPGCLQASNCRAVVAFTHFGARYQFEMLAHDSKYVAFGLSDDNKMGGDGVIECVHEESGRGSSVSAYKSWNVPLRKQNRRVDDLFGVNLDSAAIVDGAIYCKVSLDSLIKIEDKTYDLLGEEYFVLLASGSSLKPFSVGYHDVAFSSSPDKKRLGQLKAARVLDPFYNECGETKNCFGLPEGCLTTQDCIAVTAVKVDGIKYIFEMKAKNAAYVAVGLSDDQKMGGDSVIECVHENAGSNQIKAYRSWNIPNQKNNKRVPNQNEITLQNASYVDDTIYCSVLHEAVTSIEGVKFDLHQNKYNLLLAAGTSLKERSVGFHDLAYTSTAEASSLSEIKSLKPSSKILLRLHGTFMVVAWIGAASIGIVVARYYKQTWVESSCCGKDLWFGWHRLLMMFTWILSLSGSACIFLELGEWVSGPSQTHAILGVTTTVLAFFQPIFAAFRPHPDSPKRPIFNWIHWLVGNAAHIIAILTIFFAVTLSKAELPAWVDWILVVYVGFYVIIHLILSISGCLSEKSGSMRVNTFPMKDLHNGRNSMNYEQQKDNPHSGFRKFWLFIHVLFIVLITTILALIVFYAPIEPRLNALRDQFN